MPPRKSPTNDANKTDSVLIQPKFVNRIIITLSRSSASWHKLSQIEQQPPELNENSTSTSEISSPQQHTKICHTLLNCHRADYRLNFHHRREASAKDGILFFFCEDIIGFFFCPGRKLWENMRFWS